MLSYRNPHLWPASLAALPILLIFGRSATAHPEGQAPPQADAPISLRQVALHEAFEHVAEIWHSSQRDAATPDLAGEHLAGVYAAFENLAQAGCVDAAATCLRDHRGLRGLSAEKALPPAEVEYRVGLYEDLVHGADPGGMRLALDLLEEERELSPGQIEALIRGLAQRRLAPLDVQARAQLALARLLAPWSSTDRGQSLRSPARLAEAQALYESIQEDFEGTEYAVRAGSASWRLEHLTPGKMAPDFLTHDPAGNEIIRSDFIGQVTVVHFTDSAGSDLQSSLDRSGAMGRRHWDDRFVWLGIHRGESPDAMEPALEGTLLWGQNAWEGAGVSGAAQAWRVPAREVLVVIDPTGLVLAIDPSEALLDRHIADLLGDLQQQGRKRQAGSGGDSGQAGRGAGGGAERALLESAHPIGSRAQGDGVDSPEDQTP